MNHTLFHLETIQHICFLSSLMTFTRYASRNHIIIQEWNDSIGNNKLIRSTLRIPGRRFDGGPNNDDAVIQYILI
jgi:hypothetical protein